MKAAIVLSLGSSPQFGEFTELNLRESESEVRVSAAAIKQLDRAIIAGTHYASPKVAPFITGTDGVGRLDDGSPVYFFAARKPFGAMAEKAAATWWVPLPDGLDENLAAALVNPGIGAWLPLATRARIQSGEAVLILGATGATGQLAVTIARLLGAGRVIAAGRRLDVLESLGADEIVDLSLAPEDLKTRFRDVIAKGINVVIDYVWGGPALAFMQAFAQGDLHASGGGEVRFVTVGEMAGAEIALPSGILRSARLTLLGSGTGNFPPLPELKQHISKVLDLAASGQLGLKYDVWPLAEVSAAWSRPGSERIVLKV
jgi:NADPH:quinone reductase-like Zn-dependent oxidoreductase